MEVSSTSNESMFSAEASRSRARISPTPVVAQGSTGHARVFGASTPDSLANFDPATSSWRTSQLSLLEEWGEFSGTWPRSGMTRSGTAYRLQPLAPLTSGTDPGSWPTPRVSMANGPSQAEIEAGDPYKRLETAVQVREEREMWATQKATDAGTGSLNPTWVEWLMGFPSGWTDCEPSATPSSRRSLSGSDPESSSTK